MNYVYKCAEKTYDSLSHELLTREKTTCVGQITGIDNTTYQSEEQVIFIQSRRGYLAKSGTEATHVLIHILCPYSNLFPNY